MLSIDQYREIYRILDSATPAAYDCGTLCGSVCCSDSSFGEDESYIYLLPGEKEYLDSIGCSIPIISEKRSEHYLPGSWGDIVYIAHCPGENACGRDVRPIQCRTFPLEPYINADGSLEMIPERTDLPYKCPFIEGEAELSEDFRRATYEAWSMLIKDEAIRDMVMLDSDERAIDMEKERATDNTAAQRFRCPCCGHYTLTEAGAYEICPVCFWEDDPVQEEDPDYEGGANELSLNECRENYRLYGACEQRFAGRVRKPLPEECADAEETGNTDADAATEEMP